MFLKEIEIINFRNISQINFLPSNNINLIFGNNAQGKTSILESINILGRLKSHRTSKMHETIKWNEEWARIEGITSSDKLTVFISKKNKTRMVNDKQLNTVKYLNNIKTISFFPEDVFNLFNNPSERRKFIDGIIFLLEREYLEIYNNFKKYLSMRNRILKENNRDMILLNSIDEQFIKLGKIIEDKRIKTINKINPIIKEITSQLSNNEWDMELEYLPNSLNKDSKVIANEFERGYSLIGPQRSNVNFKINGLTGKNYFSQGQSRIAILGSKMAIIKMVKDETGSNPIFLIDDIGGELDYIRKSLLIEFLTNSEIQSFITSVEKISDMEITSFEIEKGTIIN